MPPTRVAAPQPAGFGNCGVCAYRVNGSAAICYACATPRLEHVGRTRCLTCDGNLRADGSCGNPLCAKTPEERGWELIYAIAMRSGRLRQRINDYKYQGRHGWGLIFARVLVGYLEANADIFDDFDAIIPMPTYVGPDGRSRDHIRFIVENAAIEAPEWPFELDVMERMAATPRLVELRSFSARAQMAENEIGPAMHVVDRQAVDGKSVLIFDDVFTSGLTLRETARKLRQAGATSVSGIVLARQAFRPR